MIGYFVIEKFTGAKDSAGFDTTVQVASKMDMNIKYFIFLPPYMRKAQCDIGIGDTVFGVADDVTGLGVALYGEGSADFQYFYDANIHIKQALTVDKDITSTTGDVTATTISLQHHKHPATLNAKVTGTVSPTGVVTATGPATGSTRTPI